MLKIKISNDHKQKSQSWEASAGVAITGDDFFGQLTATGYGADREECLASVYKAIGALISSASTLDADETGEVVG